MSEKSYDEYLENGFLYFKIQWSDKYEPELIDLSCIDHSNFHLSRYMALRDYLIDQLHEHGGYCKGRGFYFEGCSDLDALIAKTEQLEAKIEQLKQEIIDG